MPGVNRSSRDARRAGVVHILDSSRYLNSESSITVSEETASNGALCAGRAKGVGVNEPPDEKVDPIRVK